MPKDDFYCEKCFKIKNNVNGKKYEISCYLCMNTSGLMKKSVCGHYTHPMCVSFTPELYFDVSSRGTNIINLNKERYTLKCSTCNLLLNSTNSNKGNAKVECGYKTCKIAFHPYCAYKGN